MNLKHWVFEQSRRQWHRQAGTLAMLRGEAQRARAQATHRVSERTPRTIHL